MKYGNLKIYYKISILSSSISMTVMTVEPLFYRKDHVHMEKEAAKKWPSNWSFLKTKYTDVSLQTFLTIDDSNQHVDIVLTNFSWLRMTSLSTKISLRSYHHT